MDAGCLRRAFRITDNYWQTHSITVTGGDMPYFYDRSSNDRYKNSGLYRYLCYGALSTSTLNVARYKPVEASSTNSDLSLHHSHITDGIYHLNTSLNGCSVVETPDPFLKITFYRALLIRKVVIWTANIDG